MTLRVLLASFSFLFLSVAALGSQEPALKHELVRRLVVFPFLVPAEFAAPAEEAWWGTREELNKTKRFLLASKQFLLSSDQFLPRGELSPADAILLGKILDGHALLTGRLEGRKFIMTLYDAANGLKLWSDERQLHPSMSIRDQLAAVARKSVRSLLAAVPYQAFVRINPTHGTAMYEEGDLKLVEIDMGAGNRSEVGDPVEWIQITAENFKPLFQGGGHYEIYAEGKIASIDESTAVVELLRVVPQKSFHEFDLVRLPKEAERLKNDAGMGSGSATVALDPEYVKISLMKNTIKERRPLITVLSWIGSVSAFLLLAF